MDNSSPKKKRRLRLLLLLFLGAVLIGGALAYRQFWLVRPIGKGPAGPAVPHSSFSEIWATRKVFLLGAGDSVTAGFGATKGHSYFARLIANPEDEFSDMQGICLSAVLPNLLSENLSVSGTTSIQHLDRLRERLKQQNEDTLGIVVMTTGGNDVIHNYGRTPPREGAMYGATLTQAQPWIDAFEDRLDTMIDLLEASFPSGCHIFLADIYDPTDGIGDAQGAGLPAWSDGLAIHRAYNDVIHRCAARREPVHLIVIYEEFLGHGIHCRQFWRDIYRQEDPYYWYAANLEDPNDRGCDAIRRLFLIEMVKGAGQLKSTPGQHRPRR